MGTQYPSNLLPFPSTHARQPGPTAGMLLEAPGGIQTSVGVGNLDGTGKALFGENPFVEFFGAPIKKLPTTSPETRTHYDHFEAFNDAPNLFLTEYAIRVLTEQDVFWMREVLPWADGSGMNTLNWWRWTFNNHILNRRPDESVSKLLTSERSSGSEAMVNYGIALEMEYNFFNTAAGRRHYWMQHKQIYLAIMETAAMGCALELLNVEPPSDSSVLTRQPTMNKTEFLAVLKREVQFWNIFTKQENGWKIAIRMASDVLAQRGVNPTYAIFPRGAAAFIQTARPELRQSHISGRPYNDATEATLTYNGMTIRESRSFLRGEKQPPFDPFFQWRTIGGYICMTASTTKNVPPNDYRHEMRKIFQFSESANDEVPHSLGQALRYSGLIDMDAGGHAETKTARPGVAGKSTITWQSLSTNRRIWGLTPLGQSFFKNWSTWHDYLEHVEWLDVIVQALSGKSGWMPRKETKDSGSEPNRQSGHGEKKVEDDPLTPKGGGGGSRRRAKETTITGWPDVYKAFAIATGKQLEKWNAVNSGLAAEVKTGVITNAKSITGRSLRKFAESLAAQDDESDEDRAKLFRINSAGPGLQFSPNSYISGNVISTGASGLEELQKLRDTGSTETLAAHATSGASKSWLDALGKLVLISPEAPSASFVASYNNLVDAIGAEFTSMVMEAEREEGDAMETETAEGRATIGTQSRRGIKYDNVVQRIFARCHDLIENTSFGESEAPAAEVRDVLYRILGAMVDKDTNPEGNEKKIERCFRVFVVALSHRISELRNASSKKRRATSLDQDAQQRLADRFDRLRAVADSQDASIPTKLEEEVGKTGRLPSTHDTRAIEACVVAWRGTVSTVEADSFIFGDASTMPGQIFVPTDKIKDESAFTEEQIRDCLKELRLATHGAWLLQYLYCNNLQVPLSFILWTPHERFLAGSGLLMVPGRELGATFIGTANWQLASDAARKMVYGHFTCSLKSKVLDNRLITRLPNVLVTQYSSGAGHEYWDPLSERDRKRYREHYLADADIFVTAVPADFVYDGEPKDIYGRWGSWFNDRATGNPEHYHNSAAYVAVWGFAQGSEELRRQYETLERSRHNTVCLPRFCRQYEFTGSVSNSSFSRIFESRGHNGDRVYPGCADARTGAGMYLLPVNKSKRVAAVALQV